jgi:hypothetical protein
VGRRSNDGRSTAEEHNLGKFRRRHMHRLKGNGWRERYVWCVAGYTWLGSEYAKLVKCSCVATNRLVIF